MKRADVAIVGAGSAGAAAALTLAATDFRVVAIAPKPSSRAHPGEMLAAPGVALLGELGLDVSCASRSSNTHFSCWGSAALVERNAFASAHGTGCVLDRAAYDAMLWEARSDAVETIPERVARGTCGDGEWQIETTSGGAIGARFVIDCSGRSATVARARRRLVRDDRLVAVWAMLEQTHGEVEPTPAMLVEAVPAGWWYAALLPDRRLSAAFFTDADLVPRGIRTHVSVWLESIAQTTYLRQWIESAHFELAGHPRIASAATMQSVPAAGTNWAAAGDAAVAFDPLSSHGLSSALWGGRQAANAAIDALAGNSKRLRDYAQSIEKAARTNTVERHAVYDSERRFGDQPFWRRRSSDAPSELEKDLECTLIDALSL